MILKRSALHLTAFLLGGAMGPLLVDFAGQNFRIPALAAILICIIFMALSTLLSVLIAPNVFPLETAEVIRPQPTPQNWAWLRPCGDSVRSGFPLNRDHLSIGRDVRCQVMLNDASVSRQHCAIVRMADGFLLRDLNSRNGTFVNGQRIQEYLLQNGDVIAIGDLAFSFEGTSTGRIAVTTPATSGLSLDPSAPTAICNRSADLDDDEIPTDVWRPRSVTGEF